MLDCNRHRNSFLKKKTKVHAFVSFNITEHIKSVQDALSFLLCYCEIDQQHQLNYLEQETSNKKQNRNCSQN